VSVLESIDRIEQLLGIKMDVEYSDQNRIGDHICYYSDLTRLKKDYPTWSMSRSLDDIFEELARTMINGSDCPPRQSVSGYWNQEPSINSCNG